MNYYGFTGARKVSHDKVIFVQNHLATIAGAGGTWLVGDANGVDALVRGASEFHGIDTEYFFVKGKEPWQFAARSMRMVEQLSRKNGVLFAFPDKNCPDGCAPNTGTGKGSGTWLTIAYATRLGVEVKLLPLTKIETPYWIFSNQMSFF